MKYRVQKSVVSTIDKGEYVLLNTRNGKFYGLDVVGTQVWDLIKKGESKKTIIKKIAKTYNVSRKIVEKDVDDLLSELCKNELVITR